MIDTLILVDNDFKIGHLDFSNLENVKKETDEESSLFLYKARLKNFSLHFYDGRMSIIGSLAKYYLGDNLAYHTRRSALNALDDLGDELGLDIRGFRVMRIDIGATLVLDFPIPYYLDCLESSPRYKLKVYSSQTKTFYNGLRTFQFYDKLAQMRSTREPVKEILSDAQLSSKWNYLKVELQLRGRVKQLFGGKEITVADLYDKDIYKKLVDLWHNEYKKIKKKREILDFKFKDGFYTKQLVDSLLCEGLNKVGMSNVLHQIDRHRLNDKIDYLTAYRSKKKLEELENRFGHSSCYLDELDEYMRDVANYDFR
jgi:hypothetical protein